MRVKVGDQWFTAEPGQPIAVELNDGDRQNVANMAAAATRYAQFSDGDMSEVAMRNWIAEG